ncbi:unnamed protein product (macronuclear) [Paramecium tetraurelia]|uniref:Uncharacterized protein n=1 Tax=Paramecium tetraurelia TaxID=5888 RepID=A0CBH1_PARTE|nr:uncharacterized protein GSPATT00036921001 [Paramecium tetraurelia]CAK68138.1 unnamed protein product [Paramecium tetraurelia]|eukprot:XP_001435535.1 hypothetical protein (macronuclear) [Paramecium tetraurelia strain d4-2]
MQTNYSPPSTPSNILEKLKHYRKSQMSSVLRNLLNSPPSRPTTMQKPQSKLQSFSQRTSPVPKDLSVFERTQDQTVKHLDFSNLHEFEIRTPNMTPHSPLNSKNQMSREQKVNSFINTQRFNKNDKRYNIALFFEENSLIFQDIIRRKDVERIVNLFLTPMLLAQQENLTETFSEMILFLATFFLDCQEYSKATYFLKDCYTLSNLTRNPLLKVKTLLALAQCAKQYKLFDQQILIVQKALMYSWAFDYHDLEIQCYDAMGIAYFYQGNIQRAEFYHQKWTSGFLESPKSYYRVTALEFISMFEKTLPTKAIDFMSSIQGSINIPFINIANGKYYDDRRIIKYNNCNPIEILTTLVATKEFKEFNLVHHEQTQTINTIYKRQPKLPKKILEITEKYHQNKELYEFDHKIYDNPKYKLSLQQQVNHRITQSFSLQHVNQNIRKFIATQREPFIKAQQIYIRANNIQKEFIPAFVARYKKMLLQILK